MNPTRPIRGFSADQLIDSLRQTRSQLQALIACLPDGGWMGPRAEHLNPPLWEYGHIIWFQERWCLRRNHDDTFAPGKLSESDVLYDSSTVPHDSRWDLPLLPPEAVDRLAESVFDDVVSRLHGNSDKTLGYFAELCLYHELMHIEAWHMAFQNLGYASPRHVLLPESSPAQHRMLAFDDSDISLGSGTDEGFIFDNEKWQHSVSVPAFEIDANPISEAEFADFVDSGAYRHRSCWSEAGWAWREASQSSHPMYWKKESDTWRVRRFDRWTPIIPDAPMLHVNYHEARAFAKWKGRELPLAAQWLRATAMSEFIWGTAWEWLRDPFSPYPGFSPDPYRDYSLPWFHSHFELRGGGPLTDQLLKRTHFRNFYLPHRRDPFAGFRTVHLLR